MGCGWKDALAIWAPPETLCNVRSAAKGAWRAVFEALAAEGRPPAEVLIEFTHRACSGAGMPCQILDRGNGGDRKINSPRFFLSDEWAVSRNVP